MNTTLEQDGLAKLDAPLVARIERARAVLRDLGGGVVVAFSAGVDSSLLLALAAQTIGAQKVLAAIGVSPSLPRRELEAGRQLARQLGVELAEVRTGEMDDPAYTANPADRCFYCKKDLFTRLGALAGERGLAAVVSGANADDAGDFRPGLKAGKALGVRNPLMEAGLTKADVRAASRAMGLPTWDKPAMACLASRLPYGEAVTVEKLGRVEQAEDALRELGLRQVRVRDHQTVARIEAPLEDLDKVLCSRQEIVARLKRLGYQYVSLDLQGFRSGSMNEVLAATQTAR